MHAYISIKNKNKKFQLVILKTLSGELGKYKTGSRRENWVSAGWADASRRKLRNSVCAVSPP